MNGIIKLSMLNKDFKKKNNNFNIYNKFFYKKKKLKGFN